MTWPHQSRRNTESEPTQFAELVELHISTKPFISHEMERTLLESGIRDYGLSLAEARGVLHASADRASVPVEREVERTMRQWLKAAGGRRRRVSRDQFNQAATVYAAHAGDTLANDEVRRRLKAIMEADGLEPRRAGLLRSRRWYHKI